jgi:adenosylmethionine-8-amino-7-oxononanoate aminotransferase
MQANLVRNKNHLAFQSKIKHPKVDTTRVLGTIFALEIKSKAQPVTTGANCMTFL